MIYNKGVASIPGAASGPSLVSRAASLGSGQPHTTVLLVVTLEERFGQQGRVLPAAASTQSGWERWRFAQSCCVARRIRLPLGRPLLGGLSTLGAHRTPVLVVPVWDFNRAGGDSLKNCVSETPPMLP